MMLEKIILEDKSNSLLSKSSQSENCMGGNLFMHLPSVNLSSHLILTKSRANIGTRIKRTKYSFLARLDIIFSWNVKNSL